MRRDREKGRKKERQREKERKNENVRRDRERALVMCKACPFKMMRSQIHVQNSEHHGTNLQFNTKDFRYNKSIRDG